MPLAWPRAPQEAWNNGRMRSLLVVLLAAALSACETGTPVPAPPTGPLPDLVGTWRGTWGGEPLALLVTDQSIDAGYSGVYLGSWQLGGPRRPGIAGVLTTTIRGAAVSSRVEGWLGNDASGRLVLLVQTETPDGLQRLTFARVAEDRLQGSGESSFRWGPRGPAELTRQPR
jgi:hypothetical protein